MKAPTEAVEYYGLDPETATMRDVVLSVRADEACHRSVNHHFSNIPSYYAVDADEIHISNDGFKDLPEQDVKRIEDEAHRASSQPEIRVVKIVSTVFEATNASSLTLDQALEASSELKGRSKEDILKLASYGGASADIIKRAKEGEALDKK